MQKKSTIKKNILKYIDYKGVSRYKFYQETGITRGVLDQDNGMSEENTARFIAYCPDINLEWLLTNKGEMLKRYSILPEEVAKFDETNIEYYTIKAKLNIEPVPLYNIHACVGFSSLLSDSSAYDPVDYIKMPGVGKCDGSIYITGDGMYPILKAGDIVMYKQINDIQNNIIWGEMYLLSFDYDGEEFVAVKYINKSETDGYIKLVSINKYHEDRDIPLHIVRALAIIKASIRYNTM